MANNDYMFNKQDDDAPLTYVPAQRPVMLCASTTWPSPLCGWDTSQGLKRTTNGGDISRAVIVLAADNVRRHQLRN